MAQESEDLLHFDGNARLFPLPSIVLFPGMVQGLHIFEPRYRQMMSEALADDKLLTLALLKPGWESDYHGKPELYPIACIGKIFAEQELPDGRFNLQLRGLSRLRIITEHNTDKLYRSAQAELLEDINLPSSEAEDDFRLLFLEAVPTWCSPHGPVKETFTKLLKSKLPFGMLCDIVCFSLPLPVAFKQQMLETLDVEQRARSLLEFLAQNSPSEEDVPNKKTFPPGFSVN